MSTAEKTGEYHIVIPARYASERLPGKVQGMLDDDSGIRSCAEALAATENVFFLGRGSS